jgi:FdrA protein
MSEPPKTLEQALKLGNENLAVIAVPGRYAAAEAYTALRAGLHVFLFSDNVSLADEVGLKWLASERDLLMMGPDCGTAILGGVGLGFANRVRPGPVGIVGASGTGIQQLCCLLDRVGIGIAHAVGTGGRDLSAAVGGSMTRRALWTLEADPQVKVIAVISKPADTDVARRLHQELVSLSKPAVVCLLGETPDDTGPIHYADTLTDAFLAIAQVLGVSTRGALKSVRVRSKPRGGRVYGLFTGGTLCSEAARLLDNAGVPHHLIDLGEDEYTRGRAHPIIDPRLRSSMLESLRDRDDVGAVLLDVILGNLAHPDPAGVLLPAIERLREANKGLPVLAVLVGTRDDPQGLERQWAALEEAGVQVFASNARAAEAAAAFVGGQRAPSREVAS